MEITANAVQTVAVNQDILFDTTTVNGNCSIIHREGSGLVTLRGLNNNQRRARFLVTFGANVALNAGATVAPISFAIAINGEAVATSTMISTPAAVSEYNNIAASLYVDVPIGCCTQISVMNNGTQLSDVQNANLIVERVA